MRSAILLGILLTVTAACAGPTAGTTTVPSASSAPSPSPKTSPAVTPLSIASVAPTVAAPTPVPLATSTATAWAMACGTVTDFVNTSTTDGSFVLNSPGRSPLKITLTIARWASGGGVAGYVCVGLDAGATDPLFAGFVPGGVTGFVSEGTYPATMAKPAPEGFVVPQACAFVRPPNVGTDRISWWVDCGAQANRSARGTLGAALGQQGWTSCGPALGTEQFFKGTVRIMVVESSLAPGDYPRFSQDLRAATGCR
jgi:hypothetical protein